MNSSGDFTPQWSMNLSTDKLSVSSHEDNNGQLPGANQPIMPNFLNYDVPKHSLPPKEGAASTPKKQGSVIEKRMVAATPCACDGGQPYNPVAYENYDIPKHVSQVRLF